CDRLGAISEEPGLLLRRYGTPAMREANTLVAGWMEAAGLTTHEDAVGNLIGRRGDPAVSLGSHLDTVRDAGRYDGPLGVLAAIAVAERTDRPLEIYGFADEEGVRFGTAYLGSAAVAGRFDPAWPALRDSDGVALADLLRGDPATAARPVRAYAEVHIEQGPVLERLDEPVAVVTAINGQSHADVVFTGEAGHAGTVPHDARRDALAAAAEWVLAVEGTGTVGRLHVEPGGRNVIPGRAVMSLDVRDADDDRRRDAVARLRAAAERIAARRAVQLDWTDVGDLPAVAMDARLGDLWGVATRLASGAGHDAAMMASVAPATMLFVRCAGGVSHNPAESVTEADVAAALDALERLVRAV
ncbi:MAG TPA: Zn-dependent hydrolase, partial [Solirubrobacteraceae bacterium]|nr:Zn-dependent hydrolase [Solirubrobacteraceae bacterium]